MVPIENRLNGTARRVRVRPTPSNPEAFRLFPSLHLISLFPSCKDPSLITTKRVISLLPPWQTETISVQKNARRSSRSILVGLARFIRHDDGSREVNEHEGRIAHERDTGGAG